jgi:putative ABC transport system substrate-binding protein
MIKRRTFLLTLPLLPRLSRLAQAQSTTKVYRVGLLGPGAPFNEKNPVVIGLSKGFAKRGYKIGESLVFEGRAGQGKIDVLPKLVDELNASQVDVIVTVSYPGALAAKQGAKGPVVVTNSGDPVATRLVASLAHPAGNVTGISEVATELSPKRLQLLKETAPNIRKVAMLWNADDLGMTLRYQSANDAAKSLNIEVQPLGVREPDDFNNAFTQMDQSPPDAILMVTDVLTLLNRKRVFDYAATHKLPAIYESDNLVRDGGLMSYGPDTTEVFDRAAGLADRILKGAKPADLPLEEPTRFIFAINQKTADGIGLILPRSILARADDVIE